MPKTKQKSIECKNCGESWLPQELPSSKEWTKIAPLPDSEGRVTIMIMATWNCPSCGKSVMGLKGKFKDEGTTGPSKQEIMIDFITTSKEKVLMADLATKMSLSKENLEKAIIALIKKGKLSGIIKDGYFIKK